MTPVDPWSDEGMVWWWTLGLFLLGLDAGWVVLLSLCALIYVLIHYGTGYVR